MKYNPLTRRYFEAAPGAGTLERAFRGTAGSPAQGTWVQFDLRAGNAAIVDARFLAFACPHTIAVAAWVAEQSIGGPLRRELPWKLSMLQEQFAVPIEKLGRLLLLEDAWRAAAGAAIDSAGAAPIS